MPQLCVYMCTFTCIHTHVPESNAAFTNYAIFNVNDYVEIARRTGVYINELMHGTYIVLYIGNIENDRLALC